MLRRRLNSIPIKAKIAGVLSIFVVILITTFFSVSHLLTGVGKSLEKLSELHTLETSVFQLNKDISEIQRLVLAYGRTGSNEIYQKLKERHRVLDESLHLFLKQKLNKDIRADIQSLIDVSSRYREDITSLKRLRERKELAIKKELPRAFENLEMTILSSTLPLKAALQEKIFRMRFSAKSFLAHKNFQSKRAFKNLSKETGLILTKNRNNKATLPALKTYIETFDQAIIANRNYITLVNVVMSGEATEFSNLSSDLNKKVNQLTESTNETLGKDISANKKVFLLAFLFIIPIIFLTIYYSNKTITSAIIRISDTFESFILGDFSKKVPETERSDEIGKLANAAEEFKKLNKRLKEETERAQNLAQTKSIFLANMSHEIRTPMNGIMGMVDHMLDTELNNEQKEMLGIISSSGNSLSTILNDILDLSKIESGKMTFEKTPISLKKLVEEVEYLFKPKAKAKGVILTSVFNEDSLPNFFYGDLTRIKQILINLLSNAIKFTSQGSIEFQIKGIPLGNGKYALTFTIKDTGIGIAKDKQELIFKEFSQSDTSTTREFGGTGLGLSISKKLTELMGSELELESELGTGSTFSFTLNVEEASPQKETNQEETLSFSDQASRPLCLVVEDNEINTKVLTKRLEKYGLSYEVAVNGEEAMEKEEVKDFDLIFMDLQMPVMDGLTAARSLRERGCEVPIIAMTANVQESDQAMCKEAGMEYFIGKPVKKEILEEVLGLILLKNKVS